MYRLGLPLHPFWANLEITERRSSFSYFSFVNHLREHRRYSFWLLFSSFLQIIFRFKLYQHQRDIQTLCDEAVKMFLVVRIFFGTDHNLISVPVPCKYYVIVIFAHLSAPAFRLDSFRVIRCAVCALPCVLYTRHWEINATSCDARDLNIHAWPTAGRGGHETTVCLPRTDESRF